MPDREFPCALGKITAMTKPAHDVIIVGAGIGGLTLGLRLHQAGIPCRIYEAAPEIKPLGVGINLLPHASKELTELGLQDALAKVAITTTKIAYYNRFGQLIYNDPRGRYGGYEWPMFSIHRGDLQMVLLDGVHRARRRRPRRHQSPLHRRRAGRRRRHRAFRASGDRAASCRRSAARS